MAENARPGSAEAQPDPVAVAAARLRDENAILLVAQGELRTAKPRGEPLKVAEAKTAVAEAKAAVAEAGLGLAKAKLLVTEDELKQEWKSGDEAAVAEAKVAVAEAEVAVEKAKVAVAEAKWASAGPNEKGTAKSILDRAIRGLEIAQVAYKRALRAGADAVGAAAMHPGAEADEKQLLRWQLAQLQLENGDLQSRIRALEAHAASALAASSKLDIVAAEVREIARRLPTVIELIEITPSQATSGKKKSIDSFFGMLLMPTAPVHNQNPKFKMPAASTSWTFDWYRGQDNMLAESKSYEPFQVFAKENGFELFDVSSGKNCPNSELYDERVFALRTGFGAHGENLVCRARIHGRTDLIRLRQQHKAGKYQRWEVKFAVEVKQADKKKQELSTAEQTEAMLQVVGFNIDNSRNPVPVVLTNLASQHLVLWLVMQEEPLRYEIHFEECASILCALHLADQIATSQEFFGLAADFGRRPTLDVSLHSTVSVQDVEEEEGEKEEEEEEDGARDGEEGKAEVKVEEEEAGMEQVAEKDALAACAGK